jgi:hypothetical protein
VVNFDQTSESALGIIRAWDDAGSSK